MDSTGAQTFVMGQAAEGRLSYDARGNMSAHLMNPDRPRFASQDWGAGSDAEVRAAFSGYFGYYGRYTVDTAHGIVTHHVEGASFPNWIGVDQVRYFKLDGDRLTITTPPIPVAGRQLTQTLVWMRAR